MKEEVFSCKTNSAVVPWVYSEWPSKSDMWDHTLNEENNMALDSIRKQHLYEKTQMPLEFGL